MATLVPVVRLARLTRLGSMETSYAPAGRAPRDASPFGRSGVSRLCRRSDTMAGMAIVRETKLPGVGVRQEFTTHDGTVVGVLEYHDGRADVLVYDRDDPDRCTSMLHLDEDDMRTLGTLLGASQLTESIGAVQQQIEGLWFEWVELTPESPASGATIADGQYRTRTGVSIVAVIRGSSTVPAPEPLFQFEAGDTVVAVGTRDGLAALRSLLRP
jgi:TrkA domain protein